MATTTPRHKQAVIIVRPMTTGEPIEAPTGFDPWMTLIMLAYWLGDRTAAHTFRHHFRSIEGDAPKDENLRNDEHRPGFTVG